jgi:spore germination cell wall hydrolase CwlJ-like protein
MRSTKRSKAVTIDRGAIIRIGSVLLIAAAALFARPVKAEPLGEAEQEINCLALNIYFEARSEPHMGKIAVGHVVLNRMLSGAYPDSACEVIRQGGERRDGRCQFSWMCDRLSDQPKDASAWDEAQTLARMIYNGLTQDPTKGAMWYHADYVSPKWRTQFVQGPVIGRHIFYIATPQKMAAITPAKSQPLTQAQLQTQTRRATN